MGTIETNFIRIDYEKRYNECFALLKDVIQDGFHTDCVSATEDTINDTTAIDRGIRMMMWEGFSNDVPPSMRYAFIADSIYIIKSNLGFFNIIYTLTAFVPIRLISIGPFRNEDLTASYFEQIMRNAGVPQAQLTSATNVYRNLPVADVGALLNVSKRIIEEFFPDFKDIEPESISFENEVHEVHVDNTMALSKLAEFSEESKQIIIRYLRAVSSGDTTTARQALKDYINYTRLDQLQSILQIKSQLLYLNNLSTASLLTTDVHPIHVNKLREQLEITIRDTNDFIKLAYIPYDICHKYCLLVRNYNHRNYSKIIRDVINYVEFHLGEELSLNIIADALERNASSLSNLFHKETGTTLTTYIKQERVREAIALINTTDYSISEISLSVGYEDFAYFSRVFKEITGKSPREFKSWKQ